MPIDCHVKIEGVESESIHKDHKGEIELHLLELERASTFRGRLRPSAARPRARRSG